MEGRCLQRVREGDLRQEPEGDEGADLHEDLGGLRAFLRADGVLVAVQDAPEDGEEPLELKAVAQSDAAQLSPSAIAGEERRLA